MPETVPIPTRAQLQTPRSAKDFLPWVVERINEVGSTKAGKSILRLGKDRLVKSLAEEALPIGIFAARHFHSDPKVMIQFVQGNQNYDAVVTDRRPDRSPIEFIEVTQAHEGELAHLRMVLLEQKGHVGVFDDITKRGTKKTGLELETEPRAKRHDEVVADELQKIMAAVQRKRDKDYPKNTALVIPFDDYVAMRDDGDVQVLAEFVRTRVIREASRFRWLAVVGWTKRTFVECEVACIDR